jgi:hypothetical protein
MAVVPFSGRVTSFEALIAKAGVTEEEFLAALV